MVPAEAVLPIKGHTVPSIVRENIRQALQGLSHGQVTIDIHDGQVVQIDRVAKLRQFRSPRQKP